MLPSPEWILLHCDVIRWRKQSWAQRFRALCNRVATFGGKSGESPEIRLGRLLMAATSESDPSPLDGWRVIETIEAYVSESKDVEVRALVKQYLSES